MKKKLVCDNDANLRKTLAPKVKRNFRVRKEQFPLAKDIVIHINYSDKVID